MCKKIIKNIYSPRNVVHIVSSIGSKIFINTEFVPTTSKIYLNEMISLVSY